MAYNNKEEFVRDKVFDLLALCSETFGGTYSYELLESTLDPGKALTVEPYMVSEIKGNFLEGIMQSNIGHLLDDYRDHKDCVTYQRIEKIHII